MKPRMEFTKGEVLGRIFVGFMIWLLLPRPPAHSVADLLGDIIAAMVVAFSIFGVVNLVRRIFGGRTPKPETSPEPDV